MISVILFKMGKHSDFHLSFFQIGAWRDFTVVTKLMKNFKSLYGFGGCCPKIRDVCRDFEPFFKIHNLVSFHPKSLVKWSISTWSFMWWCQFIDWLKFETRRSSLLNFGMAYLFENRLLRRLERVFRCTRARNLRQDARVSWMNQNKLTGS